MRWRWRHTSSCDAFKANNLPHEDVWQHYLAPAARWVFQHALQPAPQIAALRAFQRPPRQAEHKHAAVKSRFASRVGYSPVIQIGVE